MANHHRFRLFRVWRLLLPAVFAASATSSALASGRDGNVAFRPTEMVETAAPAPQPMVVVRMRGTGQCGNRCPEWIKAQGIITPNTPGHFRDVLRQPGADKLPVVLESQGGDLDSALEIGRMIRAAGLTTIVGRSEVEGCGPREACSKEQPLKLFMGYVSSPAECSGTCLFVLAGGARRAGFWITGASLPALDSFKTRTRGAKAGNLIASYLADMGVSTGLIVRLRQAGVALDGSDMLHFGLSTGRERVEDFTGSSICLGDSPAANCLMPPLAPAKVSVAAPPRQRAAPRPPNPGKMIIWGAID
ncbi:MAG: hypothetical protein IOC82_03615 [Aestuariivirga sp.]|uniref:hypothetical protein n=1 Tax=Aestuariivirga sp. TaxID=2650926 RepID=UPI0025C709D8|nr:hypothetical protein [Aestuariivirga sp.]MCA3560103.1 hypothetical protein [Aestuariivirga sp.]